MVTDYCCAADNDVHVANKRPSAENLDKQFLQEVVQLLFEPGQMFVDPSGLRETVETTLSEFHLAVLAEVFEKTFKIIINVNLCMFMNKCRKFIINTLNNNTDLLTRTLIIAVSLEGSCSSLRPSHANQKYNA